MSYVVMRAGVVRDMAQKKKKFLENERDSRLANCFDETRAEISNSFLHKLFKRPAPTNDEIQAYWHRDFVHSVNAPDHWIPRHYENAIAGIEQILNATKFATEIHLSTADLELIS